MAIERVSNLEFKKWTELRDAIEKLYNDGFYDKLVSVHDNQYRIHNNLRFLPWHRVYLLKFERALRTIDSSLSIPYWDWENDIGKLDGFEDFHDITGAKRHFGNPWFIDGIDIDNDIMSEISFQGFSVALEGGPHNAGHNWMGGTDSNGVSGDMRTMRSPNDPAFWLHHAQVDHLWAVWQQGHPDALATDLSAEDRLLDPWQNEFSVESVNDISTLGYIYK